MDIKVPYVHIPRSSGPFNMDEANAFLNTRWQEGIKNARKYTDVLIEQELERELQEDSDASDTEDRGTKQSSNKKKKLTKKEKKQLHNEYKKIKRQSQITKSVIKESLTVAQEIVGSRMMDMSLGKLELNKCNHVLYLSQNTKTGETQNVCCPQTITPSPETLCSFPACRRGFYFCKDHLCLFQPTNNKYCFDCVKRMGDVLKLTNHQVYHLSIHEWVLKEAEYVVQCNSWVPDVGRILVDVASGLKKSDHVTLRFVNRPTPPLPDEDWILNWNRITGEV